MIYTREYEVIEYTGENKAELIAKWPTYLEERDGELWMIKHELFPPVLGSKIYKNGDYLHIMTEEEFAQLTPKV